MHGTNLICMCNDRSEKSSSLAVSWVWRREVCEIYRTRLIKIMRFLSAIPFLLHAQKHSLSVQFVDNGVVNLVVLIVFHENCLSSAGVEVHQLSMFDKPLCKCLVVFMKGN